MVLTITISEYNKQEAKKKQTRLFKERLSLTRRSVNFDNICVTFQGPFCLQVYFRL